jgi:polyisoprenoid-binding protein YceI
MARTTWQLDPAHSEVTFRVRHLMVATVSGRFTRFSSVVESEGNDITTADIEFTVETDSVDTHMPDRDAHLRSDDFFNAEKFPVMRFTGRGLQKTGNNEYRLDGELTVRDITKPISLRVEYAGLVQAWGGTRAAFEVTGSIGRKEFGLRWDNLTETGGVVVSDDVKIMVNVQYVQVPVEAEAQVSV